WTLAHMHLVSSLNPPQWLGRENLAKLAIIMVHAWRILPFAVVIFIAGLSSIPTEVEDAAKIDGATGLRKLWYVTLPLQLPIALVALLFGIVLAFPFYWMLVTMFKTNLDQSNIQNNPYVYNPVRWEFWRSATTSHVAFIFKDTNYPTWLANTVIVGAVVVGITLLVALP